MEFKLHSEYQPTGDQPEAIAELVKGFQEGNQFQTLLGVTGSGKTFTMANIIAALNKPTLIIAHNKTLAGQLYGESSKLLIRIPQKTNSHRNKDNVQLPSSNTFAPVSLYYNIPFSKNNGLASALQ